MTQDLHTNAAMAEHLKEQVLTPSAFVAFLPPKKWSWWIRLQLFFVPTQYATRVTDDVKTLQEFKILRGKTYITWERRMASLPVKVSRLP